LLDDASSVLALVLVEDEPELRQPLEVLRVGAVGLNHSLHHVAVVNFHGDEGDGFVSVQLPELGVTDKIR